MGMLGLLFVIGMCGGFIFDHYKFPGGAMTGAMLAVVIFKSCGSINVSETPHWIKFAVYGCVGVIVGNMYNPGMLTTIRDTWPVLLLSTGIILLAGCLCTWVVARNGGLSISGAYMATSPGGFNAIVALAGGSGDEAPIVMVYHLVRIYTIILLAPIVAKILGTVMK